MMFSDDQSTGRLRVLQWVSGLLTLIVAVVVIGVHQRDRGALVYEVRERNRLKLAAATEQVERYFEEIQQCLRLFSSDPAVRAMSRDSREYLQGVYAANYEQHRLPEIYVIGRDFDGSRRPFMSFERGDDTRGTVELHSAEREQDEYAVQISHIQRFEEDPSLETLVSHPVDLCLGTRGVVISIPIRSNGILMGTVAGMLPAENISGVLEASSVENLVLLTDGMHNLFACLDFPASLASWFRERFASHPNGDFLATLPDTFSAEGYVGLWTRVAGPGNRPWYAAYLYDEADFLRASGATGSLAGWGVAGMVLVIGGAVVGLCRVTSALVISREAADARSRALRESETRTRAILQAAADGIITVDEHGVIESCNAAALGAFGYTAEDVVGSDLGRLIPEPHRSHLNDYIGRYVRDNPEGTAGFGREIEGIRRDGSVFPLEVTVGEVRLPKRRLLTFILRDISERKRVQSAQRRSEESVRAIAEYTHDWETWVGPDGKMLWVNSAVEPLTGYTPGECLSMPDYPLPLIHPDDRASMASVLEASVTERTSGSDVSFRILRKDGTTRWGAMSWQPVFSAEGDCMGHRSSVRDVTDRKEAEDRARLRKAELAHFGRVSTMGEMATGLAHELNQPLAAIVNYVEAATHRMGAGTSSSTMPLKYMQRAATEARRAGDIIGHMCAFVRKRTPEPTTVDVNTLVKEAGQLVESEIRATDARLDYDLCDGPVPVVVEPIQIEQVLVNLLRNGLEAMQGNTTEPRMLLIRTTGFENGVVEIAVRDTGCGLSDEAAEDVFEAFYTTKSSGMGMGLSISRTIVEEYGGRLWCTPNDARGATFHFALPVECEDGA